MSKRTPQLTMIPDTRSERCFMLGWLIAQGGEYDSRQVATMFGISTVNAYLLLCRASRVLPIWPDDTRRPYVWRLADNGDS